MKTAEEVIETISRLSPSERQEINDYLAELIANSQQHRTAAPSQSEVEKADRGNS